MHITPRPINTRDPYKSSISCPLGGYGTAGVYVALSYFFYPPHPPSHSLSRTLYPPFSLSLPSPSPPTCPSPPNANIGRNSLHYERKGHIPCHHLSLFTAGPCYCPALSTLFLRHCDLWRAPLPVPSLFFPYFFRLYLLLPFFLLPYWALMYLLTLYFFFLFPTKCVGLVFSPQFLVT